MSKRLFDVVGAALGLLLCLPLLLIIGLWLWWEGGGPVLFRQTRVGRGGVLFRLAKFRTMVPPTHGDKDIGITMIGHPRLRRASGRFLRKTKLDELPQLWNVLRGDMSLVGPRPELEKYVALYSQAEREEVLSVRPGMTDRASLQFSDEQSLLGAGEDPEEIYARHILPAKIALYRDYVRNHTIWIDIGLILRTVAALCVPRLRDRWRCGPVRK